MIKTKRLLSLVLAVVLLSSLCACGGSSGNSAGVWEPDSSDSTTSIEAEATSDPVTPTTQEPALESEPISEPVVTSADIDVPWTDVTYSTKDFSGYTFDIVLKLSPWILLSDADLIDLAWNEVSNGKTLPQFDDWGFTRSGNGYKRSAIVFSMDLSQGIKWEMTDMYYSVGTVMKKNTTPGFDITQNNPRTVKFSWGDDEMLQAATGYIQRSIGRVLYTNTDEVRLGGLDISAAMQSNAWGPVPIILVTLENISPNTPNGLSEYILRDELMFDFEPGVHGNVSCQSENIQVHLGILKSDGGYITE